MTVVCRCCVFLPDANDHWICSMDNFWSNDHFFDICSNDMRLAPRRFVTYHHEHVESCTRTHKHTHVNKWMQLVIRHVTKGRERERTKTVPFYYTKHVEHEYKKKCMRITWMYLNLMYFFFFFGSNCTCTSIISYYDAQRERDNKMWAWNDNALLFNENINQFCVYLSCRNFMEKKLNKQLTCVDHSPWCFVSS